MQRRTFGNTRITTYPEGYCRIELPDNSTFSAVPHETEEYFNRALALGYGIYANPSRQMNAEHDAMHALLASVFGLPVSPALQAAADGEPINELTGAEEALVLAAQRFVNLCRARGLLPK